MSLTEMTRFAINSGLAKNDAQWWPKWMEEPTGSTLRLLAPVDHQAPVKAIATPAQSGLRHCNVSRPCCVSYKTVQFRNPSVTAEN